MTQEEKELNATIGYTSILDSNPKNVFIPTLKGEEYKYFCLELAQGYEIDWVNRYTRVMFNEYGKPEPYDDFLKRHPTFAKDIEAARANPIQWTQYDEYITIVDGKEVKVKLKRQGTASK